MNVLVLAPHADDAEIGCGGTIARLSDEGHNVACLIFTERKGGDFKSEINKARDVLGLGECIIFPNTVRLLGEKRQEVLDEMVLARKRLSPSLVLMPSLNDMHQDHAVVAREGIRAFRECSILGWEAPRNEFESSHNFYFPLALKHIERKVDAIRSYKSQLPRIQMEQDFIISLAKTRGAQIGVEYAEAFTAYRYLWR